MNTQDTDLFKNSPLRPIPYEEKYLDQTLSFLTKFSPDHPELGFRENFLWQKCTRYLTIVNDRIIGHMALIHQNFRFGGNDVNMGWGSGLILDESNFAAKTFAGVMLLDKYFNDPSFVYAGVGIVPNIESAYLRKGYAVCRDSVSLFARFEHPAKALRFYSKPVAFSVIIKALNLIKKAPSHPRSGHNKRIDKFSPEQDVLWESLLSTQYDVYGSRNAFFLNYKMSQPGKKYMAYVHQDPDGNIDGYIVFREARHNTKNLFVVRVCDLVGKQDAKLDLLGEANRYSKEIGADGIVAVSSRRDTAVFGKAGLWLKKAFPVGVRPEFAGKMHLTMFDSDLDNLW